MRPDETRRSFFIRSTLHSAISHMIAAGKLYAIQGSGTYIGPRVRRNLQDLEGLTAFAQKAGHEGQLPPAFFFLYSR